MRKKFRKNQKKSVKLAKVDKKRQKLEKFRKIEKTWKELRKYEKKREKHNKLHKSKIKNVRKYSSGWIHCNQSINRMLNFYWYLLIVYWHFECSVGKCKWTVVETVDARQYSIKRLYLQTFDMVAENNETHITLSKIER